MFHATSVILQQGIDTDRALFMGKRAAIEQRMTGGLPRAMLDEARHAISVHREAHGFAYTWAPILSAPDWNLKLDKAEVPSYGITLQHHVFHSASHGRVNFCPKATTCVQVCVLNGGNGLYDSVQRARNWKSDLLLDNPWSFFVHLGWELQRAVMKHGRILLRPNVNSDLQWERIVPALVNGSVFRDLTCYGYTKLPYVLDGDGWVASNYRVAYSWNEKSYALDGEIDQFLVRGGCVSVVTDRKAKHAKRPIPEPVKQWHPFFEVVDADVSDEWMFRSGVIGDLAAKGRATKLIGRKRGFVQSIYHTQP